ncbi:glycosyltransferase, group 2 family protein [Leptospira broomii serovar Hurstbridge str. 5399]|uniref:Glycosyltransferase, group 2 family protein n=1 Tax=Leptospira broomii serovar Hurstbridge str. 5399 TaxID=1049789 RepID=T0GJ90_9LEPT|nr:glycosyltransferase [Leptospira broomii]EQA46884.1 glycosyltransferase, group 2 family protein [Leptospira broomii serovar Hurstbridge str. 5399]
MNINKAPIALFAYRRVGHTQRTIDALLQNSEAKDSDLLLFCDGPKGEEDLESVLEVRSFASKISGFKSVKTIFRERNLGLAKSILTGVAEVLSNYDSIIVLEDDIVIHPQFLEYMNFYLTTFENDERIGCIHGYIYPVSGLPDFFFLKGADCWGWASWKRVWKNFNQDGSDLLGQLQVKKLEYDFDFLGSFPYTQMLRDQINGKNDSWAIRWYADCFLKGLLCLYPGRSLVQNIGLDLSGTHSGLDPLLSPELSVDRMKFVSNLPVKESIAAKKKISRFFRGKQTSIAAVKRFVRRIVSFILK